MSRDQISDTVVLLQCPNCEHEEYEAVAPETVDTSDLPTQPNYEPSVGDVVQFQYSTETKPKLILGTVASRFDVGKWRITTELHGTFIRLTGDLKLVSRAIVAVDTSDLPTQPIVTIELCRKCGEPMEELQPADELDDPAWKYFQCPACGTDRAYWWVDGRKLER